MKPTALFIAFLLACAALPAQNPFQRGSGGPPAPDRPFAGVFTGPGISLDLDYDGVKVPYTGWLAIGDRRYSCTGDAKGGEFAGEFYAGGERYGFSAILKGDELTLESDGEVYRLRRTRPAAKPGGSRGPVPGRAVPPGAGPAVPGGVGIRLAPGGDGDWVVAEVLPGGPAARAGVEPGWILHGVDGKTVDGLRLEEIGARITGPAGSTVALTLETDEEVVDAVLVRAPLTGSAPRPAPAGESATESAAGLPAWLRPGARATFLLSSATIPGVRSQLVQDDSGDWIDQGTGRRFGVRESASASGAGYAELNVVAVDGGTVAVELRNYIILDPVAGQPALSSVAGLVATTDAIDDFYIHPARLAGMASGSAPGVTASRSRIRLGDRMVEAITIGTRSSAGSQRSTYDLETGLMISISSSATGGSVFAPNLDGTASVASGSTMLMSGKLMNVRHLDLPWAASRMPSWMKEGLRLDYSGPCRTLIPGTPHMEPFTQRIGFRVERVGNGFVSGSVAESLVTGMMPPEEAVALRVAGTAMIGGLWLDPEVARGMQPGQILDRDPVTGVTTTFAGISNGIAEIAEESALNSIRFGYDLRSGVLAATRTELRNGIGRTVVELRLQQR